MPHGIIDALDARKRMLEEASTIFVRATSQTYIRSIYHSEGFRTKMNLSSYKNELRPKMGRMCDLYGRK